LHLPILSTDLDMKQQHAGSRRLLPRLLYCWLSIAILVASDETFSGTFTAVICPAAKERPRNTEADIVKLKDGSLLLGYSEFVGADSSDFSEARIAGKISRDGGRSWSAPFILLANTGRMNVMSVNFLRLRSGKLALAYIRKNSQADCQVFFRISADDAKTWSPPVKVSPAAGYWGINNARLVQLKSGRILAPLWFVEDWNKSHHTKNAVAYSDDEGRTWHSGQVVDIPQGRRGADEPAVVELRDGRILMIIRSDLGTLYRAYSADSGEHWTTPESTGLPSPTAPASIARIPSTGDLLLIWNNSKPGPQHTQDRFPLTSAISRDEGQTWRQIRNLDDSPGFTYAYASISFPEKDRAIITYYASPRLQRDSSNRSLPGETLEPRLFSLKEKIVPVTWFYKTRQ